jgi:hypothetical protein
MEVKKHPNSRIITVYRKDSFISQAQETSAPEFLANSKKSIGSYWVSNTSKAVASGLTFAEQKLLLPSLVDCEAEDRNFRSAVTKFYENIKTTIPYGKGKDLEIGLEKDNNLPLANDNQPLELHDYIAYRHLLGHPQVAKSKDDAGGLLLKEFYIFDPQAVEDKRIDLNKSTDDALELYLKLKEQPEKINMVLTMMNVDPRVYNDKKNAAQLKTEKLKELVQTDPHNFVKVLGDPHLEDVYWIKTLLNTKILSYMGDMIVDTETKATIGHSMKEAIGWMRNPEFSESVVIYRARAKKELGIASQEQTAAEKSV